jgi:hypothetical protein
MARIVLIIAASLGLLLLFTANVMLQNSQDVKIGYIQTSNETNWQASFDYFMGKEDTVLKFDHGEKIILIYNMELEKGVLEMRVIDKNGNEIANLTESGELALTFEEEQFYSIEVIGNKARGSYQLSWANI